MSIGYACLTVGVANTNMKSCRIGNATDERLRELIGHNLESLENMIDYNIKNNIKLFRISSDMIPFGSSPANQLDWTDIFAKEFARMATKIKESGMRVSMHPGQYTVLNSPKDDVVDRAIEDLNYHSRLLQALGADATSKIILHIGGVYGEKTKAMDRFMLSYKRLNPDVKDRLVIENDDRSYTIEDVLAIGEQLGIPVVFDNLHHAINQATSQQEDVYWLERCKKTWKEKDGKQKIHYSQQDPLKKPGGHSTSIGIREFIHYYETINGQDLDIMLEVKDKNLSAIKCINTLSPAQNIVSLEEEWAKYKYSVLEKSHQNYNAIRELLKDKKQYPAVDFYELIEESLDQEEQVGSAINGLQHVWGYFKNTSTDKEKADFLASVNAYEQGQIPLTRIKTRLEKLAIKYQEDYLLDSYYFSI